MAAVKDASRIAAKWARVTPQRAQDYTEGVQSPRTPWDSAAKAGEDRYKSAVQEAAARGAYGKGVTQAGQQKWQSKSLAKGPSRFAEGDAVRGPALL